MTHLSYLTSLNLFDLCFPAPFYVYSFAGSIVVASALGAAYGLIGRVSYPSAGISPLNYAVWFTVAYQIKTVIDKIENYFENGLKDYLKGVENIPEDQLKVQNNLKVRLWKVIRFKNSLVTKVDGYFSSIFKIRPYQEVYQEDVNQASYLEMCRYRIWKVFKLAVYDTLSSAAAFSLLNRAGLFLPEKTVVPIFLIVRTILFNIVLIPTLHLYFRWTDRFQWARNYLPSI